MLRDAAGPFAVQHSPEVIDADVAAGHPPRFFQTLSEGSGAQLPLRVALNVLHHHCDPPHPIGLLRLRRDRPRRRPAKQCDELAPRDHSITSSALASSVGGISMPSVFAVCRLMTNSNLEARKTGKSAGSSPLRMRLV